jgi:small subunit ribosomal protein S16
MLTIRLTRKGKKNQPFFKVVVIDKRRSSKGGRAVEVLGFVDPLTKRKSLEKERILYWISKGAKPSDTINNLLIQEKIIEGKKINVSKISKSKLAKMAAEKAKATPAPAPVPAEAPTPIEVPAPVETSAEPAPAEEPKP